MRANLGLKENHTSPGAALPSLCHIYSLAVASLLLHWPRNNRPLFYDFTLQHADSEGALLGERRPLQAASGVSTLASGLDELQAVSQRAKDLRPRRDSQEQLSPTDSGTKVGSSPSEGRVELEEEKGEKEEEEGDSYKEDILLEDDQVADFASSVLAAISCWQFKARALLSTHFTTVRVSDTHSFLTSCTLSPSYQILCHSFSIGDLIVSTLFSNTNRTF